MCTASRFHFCLPAIALFAAAMTAPCVAQENHSTAPDAAERVSPAPRSGDDGPAVTGKDVNSPTGKSSEANGIDTRITVTPRHSGEARDKAGHAEAVKTVSPRNLLTRPRPAAAGPAMRNAIGVTVIRHDGFGESGSRSTFPHSPVSAPNTKALTNGGQTAHFNLPMERSLQNAHAGSQPIAPMHGGISGTSLAHGAAAPAAIGGPVTSFGGISGTSFRPKHSAQP